jgi:flagellar motor switch protein FliN
VTQLSERLLPALETAGAAAAEQLGLAGVHAGNVVAVADPIAALPIGSVRAVRGTVADEAGLDVTLALTDEAAQQVQILAGTGDDLVGALLPAANAVIAAIGRRTGTRLELANLVEMGSNEPFARPATEIFTSGLFLGDEQIGNVFVVAVAGALSRTDDVAAATFPDAGEADAHTDNGLALLRGVEMRVTAELGRTRLPVSHVLDLGPGAVVELDRVAGSPVDVLVNGTVIAHGEVVVIDEEYGVRITEIVGGEDD